MTSLYVLALTDEKMTPPRVAGRKLEVISIAGTHAVVQTLEDRPVLSEEALRQQHELVMEIARRSNAILPVRFGSFVTRKELEEALSLRKEDLRRGFDLVRHREQMTIRVFGALETPAPAAPAARTSGTQYLRTRRAATAGKPLPAVVRDLVSAVRSRVKAERIETGAGRVRATVYHLIERGRSAEYREAIESVPVSDTSMLIRVTGPWPPFAFVPELWP